MANRTCKLCGLPWRECTCDDGFSAVKALVYTCLIYLIVIIPFLLLGYNRIV